MRRGEKEMKNRQEIDATIRSCKVFRLGLCDGDEPYIVPLCFGYDGKALYFHCAAKGRKIDLLKKSRKVCFEFDILDEVLEREKACDWSLSYRCVMGVGTAEILTDLDTKHKALELLMAQYSEKPFTFPEKRIENICIVKVIIDQISGKQAVD